MFVKFRRLRCSKRGRRRLLLKIKCQQKRHFLYLERRLVSSPELYDKYRSFIEDFFDLGHSEVIPQNEIDNHDCITPPPPILASSKKTPRRQS